MVNCPAFVLFDIWTDDVQLRAAQSMFPVLTQIAQYLAMNPPYVPPLSSFKDSIGSSPEICLVRSLLKFRLDRR